MVQWWGLRRSHLAKRQREGAFRTGGNRSRGRPPPVAPYRIMGQSSRPRDGPEAVAGFDGLPDGRRQPVAGFRQALRRMVQSASPFGVPRRRGFQPGGVEEGGSPCVESGPPGLRAALSQRCPGERKTDGALSRLGGRALALARAASSRLPVWPGSTRARGLCDIVLPMASPGPDFVARSQVLLGPNVRASATCKGGHWLSTRTQARIQTAAGTRAE